MNNREILLDIDQFIEPSAQFVLNGKTYDCVQWDAWGIVEQRRVERDWARVLEIDDAKDDLPPTTDAEYDALVRSLLVRVSSITAEEVAPMKRAQVKRCLTLFFGVHGMQEQEFTIAAVAAMRTKAPPTTASSSLASIITGRKRAPKPGSPRPLPS